jgi:hypothetical protein
MTENFILRAQSIVNNITFPGLAILLDGEDVGCRFGVHHVEVHLRVHCHEGVCNVSGAPKPWSGRKWRLSVHMTDGEIVQTAWLAVVTALEHEAREQFKYKGEAVFDPHYDIDKLVALRRSADSIKERD